MCTVDPKKFGGGKSDAYIVFWRQIQNVVKLKNGVFQSPPNGVESHD